MKIGLSLPFYYMERLDILYHFIRDSNNVTWFMTLFYKVNMHINYFVMFPGVIQLSINAIFPAAEGGDGEITWVVRKKLLHITQGKCHKFCLNNAAFQHIIVARELF